MSKEYIIYCDESAEKGAHFSDFYGGVMIESDHIDEVRSTLAAKKKELNLGAETKWGKVPGNPYYLQKYINLVDCFFDLVGAGKIKVRIMFRQNTIRHRRLTQEHHDQRYFILYYTFLKWAFGLDISPALDGGVRVRIYPDNIPDTAEQIANFRAYLVRLSNRPEFRLRKISIKPEDVTDVVSHEHPVLQCLDIVLGSMHFRLNDLHRELDPVKNRRKKRTRNKEKLYKHIKQRIEGLMFKNFNIGTSTGQRWPHARWSDPYRHWRLMPRMHDREVLPGSKKKRRRKTESEAP
jgi:hypothetical protein